MFFFPSMKNSGFEFGFVPGQQVHALFRGQPDVLCSEVLQRYTPDWAFKVPHAGFSGLHALALSRFIPPIHAPWLPF
jgi:hypothetical protein